MSAGCSAAYGAQQGPDNQMELSQDVWDHNSCDILGHSDPPDNESGADSGDKEPQKRPRSSWVVVRFDGVFNYNRM